MNYSPPVARAPTSTVSVESRASWTVAVVALLTMAVSFGAPWVAVVALKTIAADAGGARSIPAVAGALGWVGVGFGGVLMGWVAGRIGMRATIMFGAAMICAGLAISSLGGSWPLFLGHGLFIGLLGNGSMNAPFYVYVSKWFDRRRGSALALISSGSYVAGAIWPPVFERAVALAGWHKTMLAYGFFEIAIILPLAAIYLRPPPEAPQRSPSAVEDVLCGAVLGWPRNAVFGLICAAAFLCCMPMALPQTHLVAFCSDLGITPAHGAAMLSVALGCGFLSRQLWGWFSDRNGGLLTLAVCSACQAAALVLFVTTQDEIGLFTVSVLFGFGFAGLVPAYVLVLRALYPVVEASWRVPTLLLFSGCGMGAGAWIGGALYDVFGYYAPAFIAAIIANLCNLAIVLLLFLRSYEGHRASYRIA